MKIGFIGAGKVGFTLGKYFAENGTELSGYYSSSVASAKEAAEFTGSKYFENAEKLIGASDVIFLTVPDGAIKDVYLSLPREILKGKQLCHCSGALSSKDAFPEINEYGAKGTSIHPLFPVSSKYESYKVIDSAFFCIEGDCAEEWSRILSDMGNPVRIIDSEIKIKYHAACVAASNLVCGLIAESTELLTQCGFSEKEALDAIRPLAMANINRIFDTDPVTALTGPVERNDVSTVKKHLDALGEGTDAEIYRSLSLKLTEMAEKRHSDADYSEMRAVLSNKSLNNI
ncbi:MAG: DUF2520 domain-containing protein [Oscillospiraceae bacterium]|nr:DUF2520 domain-containing protein [Oscillospiraceae bacterium]